jgi:uncharacterized integral membrane protein
MSGGRRCSTEVKTKLLRKILATAVLVPLAILIIAFAVANRQPITVSFDPFNANGPAAAVSLPLFALIILAVIVGVVVGGIGSWLRQGRWRGRARRLERELRQARDSLAVFEQRDHSPLVPQNDNPPQRLKLRPPAR